jgi:hypothetical protein
MTNEFLNGTITNPTASVPDVMWDTYAKGNPEFDLQDIAHIFNVHKTVEQWFKEKQSVTGFNIQQFTKKLLDDVKLIVNEVDGRTSEEKVFGNLNSKRVPLDGSDLVRAILITRVAREEGRRENDLKNIVYVNERRVKLGWELDQINSWWARDEVRGYFSKFVSVRSELVGGDKPLFNDEKYPINHLYLLYAESKGHQRLTLDLIEQNNNSAIALYKDILKLHATLLDWYDDKEIYHFLGFLFNVKIGKKKADFNNIWTIWEKSGNRAEFIVALKRMMKKRFMVEDDQLLDFCDLTINWYADRPDELMATLILMDIMHAIKKNQPKLPFRFFNKGVNDIEHIFPQNPAEIANKKHYVQFLNKLQTGRTQVFDLSKYEQLKNSDKYQKLINDYIEDRTAEIPINAIGNLVLLFNKLNKSISNSIYASKRSRIIEYHSLGNFIQPHTFKVFTRDFNDDQQTNKDFEYWTKEDIERNCAYINREVSTFFSNIEL